MKNMFLSVLISNFGKQIGDTFQEQINYICLIIIYEG